MNDILWTTEQRSDTLQRLLDETQGVWSDEAQREIHTRYLNPHTTDNTEMLRAFKDQYRSLYEASAKLQAIESFIVQNNVAGKHVEEYLTAFEEEIQRAIYEYELCLQGEMAARAELPQVEQLIEAANKMGK